MVRGRPRQFDPDVVIDRALEIFWRDGYEGASVNDLADAMGLSKPSLYAAFGDKESLFIKALARYGDRRRAQQLCLLEQEPDPREAIARLLYSVADSLCDPALPGGCLVTSGTGSCDAPAIPEMVREALTDALHTAEDAIGERLVRAQVDGTLPPDVDVAALSAYFNTVIAGLGIQAKARADQATLRAVVSTAMRAWPVPVPST